MDNFKLLQELINEFGVVGGLMLFLATTTGVFFQRHMKKQVSKLETEVNEWKERFEVLGDKYERTIEREQKEKIDLYERLIKMKDS